MLIKLISRLALPHILPYGYRPVRFHSYFAETADNEAVLVREVPKPYIKRIERELIYPPANELS